ncbi:MAG: 3-hydroxyacyl-ACP dehydratase FabZ [Rickettsia endosymbiont of Bryobia graminum]|nr:3-hydroxyacyl-ACP dehydratase FabZ [Rickettsia endosymbiont of Bryobia graminum]
MKINIIEIMEMLPHRYPFLLIDRVEELILNESIIGIKNVTFNEPQFTGHFPNNPVMPGVLIVEAMAQLSAILVAKSLNTTENKDVLFMSIEETKFRKIVQPGDTLYIYAKIEQNRGAVWKFSSYVKVDDEIVAESKFTAMVRNRK